MHVFARASWTSRLLELLSSDERLSAAGRAAREHAEAFRVRPLSQTTLRWHECLPG
jgi:hypothetical protein